MKNVFNQVKNNIRNGWCLGLALLPFYSNHPNGMNWQSGGMVKITVNL